ncbi:succinate dehydrogenase assembly factor 2 [soil metagenome]
MRWRSRRGLVENDIILDRFFEQHEMTLSDDDVAALTRLLDLPDNDLLDLVLARREPDGALADEAGSRVLGWLRSA